MLRSLSKRWTFDGLPSISYDSSKLPRSPTRFLRSALGSPKASKSLAPEKEVSRCESEESRCDSEEMVVCTLSSQYAPIDDHLEVEVSFAKADWEESDAEEHYNIEAGSTVDSEGAYDGFGFEMGLDTDYDGESPITHPQRFAHGVVGSESHIPPVLTSPTGLKHHM